MIKNFLLLTGPDAYRRGARKNFYIQAFRQKYPDGEVERFETKSDFNELSNAVLTPNLFGGRRLLIAEDFWTPEHFEQAEKDNFFVALDESTDLTLICIESSLDKRTKAAKWLLKNAKVELFEHLSEGEIIAFLQQQSPTLGRSEAMKLMSRCGENLHNLSQEIQKLSLMTDGQPITVQLIEEHTLAHPKVVLWDFLADLSQKRAPAALKKFRDLRNSGESTHYIFAMLIREIGIHAKLRAGLDQGLPEKEIAARTKLHPFVVKKTLPLSRRFDRESITHLYQSLLNIDRRLKTGGIVMTTDDQLEFELAVEKFILQVCQK